MKEWDREEMRMLVEECTYFKETIIVYSESCVRSDVTEENKGAETSGKKELGVKNKSLG